MAQELNTRTIDVKNRSITFEGLKILSSYEVYSLFVGALEGGSNYWYEIVNDDDVRNATPELENEPFVDRMVSAIDKGIAVVFFDLEENKQIDKVLTLKSILRAEELLMTKHRRHLGYILIGQDDAITADVFLQLCLFEDVIYG